MFEISIEDSFDAAHSLREYTGACRHLHSHTYKVMARFRLSQLDDMGMALDFRRAKEMLRSVIDYLDHKYINELPEFEVRNPTAENIAQFIYEKLKSKEPHLYSVTVWETATSCATYFENA